MPLPTWVQTSRYTGLTITLKRADGTAYTFPGGATVTGRLTDQSGTTVACTGTFTPTTGGATVVYAPSAADVTVAGQFTLQLTITVGGVPDVTFEESWKILPKR